MKHFIQRVRGKVRRTAAPVIANARRGGSVAIIGAGRIAPTHIDAWQESGRARVAAIADVDPASLAKTLDRYPALRAFRDCRQMFKEIAPRYVSICTWPQSHRELVNMAVKQGVKGILCEKPLALSMAEVDEMVRVCEQAGVSLAGGHQYRFHPFYIMARTMIARGQLGRISRVAGTIKSNLANNGPHLLDTIRYLLNDREAVEAECYCNREGNVQDRGLPVEQSATGRVLFTDNIELEFATGDLATAFFEIRIAGSNGELLITPSSLMLNGNSVKSASGMTQHLYRRQQFGQFVRWTEGRIKSYAADSVQSGKTCELVLALYESARLDAPVSLPLENRGPIQEQLYPDTAAPDTATAGVSEINAAVPANSGLAIDGAARCVTSWFGNRPHIGRPEWIGVSKVLASGNLNSVSGSAVKEFERVVARTYGSAGAVASSSGTASIHVALGILGLEPGDEVITTPITDMGSIIPILWCNGIPVFADIDPLTGNITADSIEQQITGRTRAVVLVHLFGRPANVVEIRDLLKKRGIVLIEDCSQAHLARVDEQLVGTFGDFGCFSLQQAKQITCGDGGFTLVRDEAMLQRARLFVDKGWNRRSGTRAHEFLGMNYRMSEMQGAVALAQLKRLPGLIQARQSAANDLFRHLQATRGLVVPDPLPGHSPSWWIFNFCIDEDLLGISPDLFARLLQVEGVRARRNYLPRPIFEEEVLKQKITYGTSQFPYSISDAAAPDIDAMPGLQEFMNRQMVISWSSRVQSSHVSQICDAISRVAGTKFVRGAGAAVCGNPAGAQLG